MPCYFQAKYGNEANMTREEKADKAMKDPEIQAILQDPVMQQVRANSSISAMWPPCYPFLEEIGLLWGNAWSLVWRGCNPAAPEGTDHFPRGIADPPADAEGSCIRTDVRLAPSLVCHSTPLPSLVCHSSLL